MEMNFKLEYEPMKLKSLINYLSAKYPVGHESIAVVENLSESNINQIKQLLKEMKQTGVKNIVYDLSKFPETTKEKYLALLYGASTIASGFETRFTGVTTNKTGAGEITFRDYISSKIAESYYDAVKSFIK